MDGTVDGRVLGSRVGSAVGATDGMPVGSSLGVLDGFWDGLVLGIFVWSKLGIFKGWCDGAALGFLDKQLDGTQLGNVDGMAVGWLDEKLLQILGKVVLGDCEYFQVGVLNGFWEGIQVGVLEDIALSGSDGYHVRLEVGGSLLAVGGALVGDIDEGMSVRGKDETHTMEGVCGGRRYF